MDWGPILAGIVSGGCVGALTAWITPGQAWKFEKKRLRQKRRAEVLSFARDLAEGYGYDDGEFEPENWEDRIAYSQIRPYLSEKARRAVEDVARSREAHQSEKVSWERSREYAVHVFSDDLARIESDVWGLV